MNQACVFSQEDLAHLRRAWFVLGCVVGFCAAAVIAIAYFWFRQPWIVTGAPELLSETAVESTWRIPVRQGGRTFDCRLTMRDRRSWSVSC